MSEADSKAISAIRFPLAVMVVAIHSYIAIDGWSYNAVANQGIGSNVAQFFMIAIAHVLTHVAVPTFFVISGYLFFNNFGEGIDIWKQKYKSRIKTVIVPYLLWIILYIIYFMIRGYKGIITSGIGEWLQSHGGFRMFWCSETWNLDRVDLWGNPAIAYAPFLVPFWFLRDLIVCIAISPIFFYLFNKNSLQGIRLLGLIIISFLYFTQTSLRIPGLSSSSIFFFGIGSALSLNNKSLVETFARHKRKVWALFMILLIIEVALDGHNTFLGNNIYPFYVAVGVYSMFPIKPRIESKYQHFTFFIFAFHIFILPFVGAALLKLLCVITKETCVNNVHFADNYPILIILEYLFRIGLTIVICMGTYTVFNKLCPKFCKLLCGR